MIDPKVIDIRTEEFIKQRLQSHEPNPIRDLYDVACADKIRAEIQKLERQKVVKLTISEDLTTDQENRLVKLYPSLNLVFTKRSTNSHSFAAASRQCELSICLQRTSYDKNIALKNTDGRDDYIVDIGGNYAKHLTEGHEGIHSCCPMLDDRDIQRFVQRRENLKKQYDLEKNKINVQVVYDEEKTKKERLRKFLEETQKNLKSNQWVCLNKSQNCARTARYGIMIHSNYDITLRNIGDIMVTKNMSEIYGTFIYDDRVFYMTEGYIADLDCYFSYSKDKEYIEFAFKNDMSMIYRHKTRVYMSYLLVNTFVDSSGRSRFVLELLENRGGIQYFKITRLPFVVTKTFSPLNHKIWFKSLENKVKVTFPVVDVSAMRKGSLKKMIEQKILYLDKDLIDKIMSHAMTSTENKFKPVEIMSFVQAYTSRIFFGEDVLSRMPSMTFDEKYHLSLAVYVEIFRRKYDAGKVLQFVLECIYYDRDLIQKGFFRRLLSSPTTLYSVFKAALPNSVFSSYLGSFYLMAFNASKSPVDGYKFIEEIPSYQANDDELMTHYVTSNLRNRVTEAIEDITSRLVKNPCFSQLEISMVQYPKILVPSLVLEPTRLTRKVLMDNFRVDVSIDHQQKIIPIQPVDDSKIGIVSLLKNKILRLWNKETNLVSPQNDDVGELPESFSAEDVSSLESMSLMDYDFSDIRTNRIIHQDIINLAKLISEEVSDDVYKNYMDRNVKCDYDSNAKDFISRAEYKLKEIADIYALAPCDNVLDLCAGPGGFTKFLLTKTLKNLVVHYYKDSEAPCSLAISKLSKMDSFGKLKIMDLLDTDLLEPDTRSQIDTMLENFRNSFGIITADGALHNDTFEKELENYPLIKSETDIIQDYLTTGGTAVIKTFGFYDHKTLFMLSEFLSKFSKFHIHRSSYVAPFSLEIYLVAVGYRSRSASIKSSTIYKNLKDYMLAFENSLRIKMIAFLKQQNLTNNVDCVLTPPTEFSVVSKTDLEYFSIASEESDPEDDLLTVNTAHTTASPTTLYSSNDEDDYCTALSLSTCKQESIHGELVKSDILAQLSLDPTCHLLIQENGLTSLTFYSSKSPFSNFYEIELDFLVSGRLLKFRSAEHAYQYLKAIHLGQLLLAEKIKNSKTSLMAKKLGKSLNYLKESTTWMCVRESVMYDVISTKFRQHPSLNLLLEKTYPMPLMHTVSDSYWGIGLSHYSASKKSSLVSSGSNIMGCLLMKYRDTLVTHSISSLTPPSDSTDLFLNSLGKNNYMDVRGDGSCLYYALMMGDTNDHLLLRSALTAYYNNAGPFDDIDSKMLFAELEGMGGAFVLKLFSRCYDSNVVVADLCRKQDYSFGEASKPLHSISLAYNGTHYVLKNTCTLDAPVVVVPRHFNYNPLNVSHVLLTLDNMLSKNSTKVSRFVSYLLGSKSFHYATFESLDYTSHMFYNAVANYCAFHSQCASGKLFTLLQDLNAHDYEKTLYALVSIPDTNFEQLQAYVDSNSMRYFLINIPWLHRAQYSIIIFAFDRKADNDVSMSAALNLSSQHIESCAHCQNDEFSSEVSGVWFNSLSNTYYTCCKAVDSINILKTSHLPVVDRLYNIKIYEKKLLSPDSFIIDRDGYYEIPVYCDVGSDCPAEGYMEILLRNLENHCRNVERVPLIGLAKTRLSNIKKIVDLLATTCERLYVEIEESTEIPMDMTVFSPEYCQTLVNNDIMLNSMKEAREMWKITENTIISNVKNLHNRYIMFLKGTARVPDTTNDRPDYGLLDLNTGKFMIQPREKHQQYSRGYDGTGLVSLDKYYVDGKFKPGLSVGMVSVTRDMRIVNADAIYTNVKNVDLKDVNLDHVTINLVEGVPGCGKTTYIVNNHKFAIDDLSDVVLTATRETAEDIRKRVCVAYSVSEDLPILKKRYRTIDSFLVNFSSKDVGINTLWIDEGLMKHFGEIMWCVYLSGAKNVRICGDRAQIPFINRNGSISLLYSKMDALTKRFSVEFLQNSYRCPADVVCYLNSLGTYPGKVSTINKTMRSIHVQIVTGIADVPFLDFKRAVILTYTQREKQEVTLHLNKIFPGKDVSYTVNTIHEYQGKQAADVVLIRLQMKEITIYNSVSHQLVALTRHTHSFTYYTVKDDSLAVICRRQYSTNQLFDALQDSLVGGGKMQDKQFQRTQHPLPLYTYEDSSTRDILKTNKIIREIIIDHDGFNVSSMPVRSRGVEVPFQVIPEIPVSNISDPVNALQHLVDVVFPGASSVDSHLDRVIFEGDPLMVTSERANIIDETMPRLPKYDNLKSRLRTNCPTQIIATQKQVVKAFFQRNGNVPDLYGENDETSLVNKMVDVFTSTYISDRALFEKFSQEPLDINVASIEEWLSSQPPQVKDIIEQDPDVNVFLKDLQLYNFSLKRMPKPKLDIGNESKYPSSQTIAHHCKKINAIFCPIVRELKKRLLSVLKYDKLIYTDMSVQEFENILNYRLPPKDFAKYTHMLEVDFSKYDKSQGRVALKFELAILRLLGFPPQLLATWTYMHVYTRLWAPDVRFKADVCFQRKSGDAMTFFGNTMFLMSVLAHTFDLSNAFCMFSGDDSLIFSTKRLDSLETIYNLSFKFNLESKLLHYNTPYFCSKFLLQNYQGSWSFIPDPIKMLIKLGRNDLVSYDHVKEYHISLKDNARHFTNGIFFPALSYAVCDRYKLYKADLTYYFSALYTLLYSESSFENLYYLEPGANLNPYRMVLPSIDI
ncbi:hypothetical protein [Xinzhou nematode virus 1]|uniref:hypothetical protein n=1 Tax=Xinzhou nematode virus 1 TaxID=1923769 RepID=UPI00090BDFCF|nr:hypothetical protein [Xinzhou nematode virus 1]APG77854.1 hypothetical protein [Xinzhou nematode virus 1]